MTEQAVSIRAVDADAEQLLSASDRGRYCAPAASLPEVQHGLTSAAAAIAFAAVDFGGDGLARGWRELETLFSAQWTNGMTPAIVYWGLDPAALRAPETEPTPGAPFRRWRTRDPDGGPDAPQTVGFSAPPTAITSVRMLWELDETGRHRDRLEALYPRLLAWRQWFRAARLADGDGPVFVTDPRESARDAGPEWDEILAPPETPGTGDAFRAADPGVTFSLVMAERDLATLARALGRDEEADALERDAARLLASADRLWNDAVSCFCVREFGAGGRLHDVVASSAFLAWAAGLTLADPRSQRLLATFETMLSRVEYAIPSVDPTVRGFDAARPWRGAVGVTLNFLIAQGLATLGETRLAARLRLDARRLIQRAGFVDGFDPWTARVDRRPAACTAAIWLAWASPNAPRNGAWAQMDGQM